jgi:1-acyl-sn-glycerol-3-phosphate acyltransferase
VTTSRPGGRPHEAAPGAPGRWWGRIVGFVVAHVLWRTKVQGLEHVAEGPVLLAVNHVSVLDGPLVYSANRRSVQFLVKTEMFRGFFGWVLRQVGQIPVDRSGTDRAALAAAVAVLRAGGVAGIFPEGSRGRGDVAAVRTGIAWIALQSGAPVVPVAVLGTRRTGEPAGGLPRLRRRLHVVHGEPFRLTRPEGVPGKQALAMAAEQVRARLVEHVERAVALTGEPLPDDPGRSVGAPSATGRTTPTRPVRTSTDDTGQAGTDT